MQTQNLKSNAFNFLTGFLVFVFFVFGFPAPPVAAFNQPAAVNYLKSQTLDEWMTMALASANALAGVNLDFLKPDPGNAPTDLEKRILAIVSAGLDPETFGSVNLVQKLAETFSGTEINPQANLLNDDIFGLLAFTAAGEKPEIRNELTLFIKQNQNSDGGWSYTKTPSSSDSNDTAMAIMALLANGESPHSPAINKAFAYLATTKTASSYSFDNASGFGPDAASTAWVISALRSGGRSVPPSATAYLENLQRTDGSFSWKEGGSGSALMTVYAVIALNNDFYPVAANQNSPSSPSFTITILDPQQNSIFSGTRSFTSSSFSDNNGQTHNFNQPVAIGTVIEAARAASFSYSIKNTSLGLFVECIASFCPSGNRGWLYAVNRIKPSVGASQYVLTDGDRVIWFYGAPNDPLPPESPSTSRSVMLLANIENVLPSPFVNLSATKTNINLGETVELTWNATDATAVTSSFPSNWAQNLLSGTIVLQPAVTTTYTIAVVGPGGTAQASVTVIVNQQLSIVFGIDTSVVDFGNLKAGDISPLKPIKLTNSGNTNLRIKTTLQNADNLYQQGLFLDNILWPNYGTNLDANLSQTVNLDLRVPVNFTGTGLKSGTLIFWATPR